MRNLIIVILTFAIMYCWADETIHLTAPEFMQSPYDQYSYNYLNVSTAGMGDCSVAKTGTTAAAIKNPACLNARYLTFYTELSFKYQSDEMAEYIETTDIGRGDGGDSEGQIKPGNQTYHQTMPIGIVGFAVPYSEKINFAFVFSIPQSIEYNAHMLKIAQQSEVRRTTFPSFSNLELSTGLSYEFSDQFAIGLNVLNNFYNIDQYRLEGTLEEIELSEHVLRFQPGVLLNFEKLSLGFTLKTPAKKNFEICDYDIYYQHIEDTTPELASTDLVYETKIPLTANFGVHYEGSTFSLSSEIEFENTSYQSKYYDDRFKFKIGANKDISFYSLKAGAIFVNKIFDGVYDIPYTIDGNDEAFVTRYYDIRVNNDDQLWLTAGTTIHLKVSDVYIAFMSDVMSEMRPTQVKLGMELRVKEFLDVLAGE